MHIQGVTNTEGMMTLLVITSINTQRKLRFENENAHERDEKKREERRGERYHEISHRR